MMTRSKRVLIVFGNRQVIAALASRQMDARYTIMRELMEMRLSKYFPPATQLDTVVANLIQGRGLDEERPAKRMRPNDSC